MKELRVTSLASTIALGVLAATACSSPDTGRMLAPGNALSSAAAPTTRTPDVELLEVCKDYAAGSIPPALTSFTVGTSSPGTSFQLAPGECRDVWTHGLGTPGTPGDLVTVTETVPNGFTAAYNVSTIVQGGTPQPGPSGNGNSVTVTIGGPGIPGALVVFTNTPIPEPPPVDGRMTGGGFSAGVIKATGGFTLHCDITLSNNLEINWNKNKWHLDKPITKATCIDDPAYDPTAPVAPFDTFIGEGLGEYNGVAGSLAKFTFIDAGEPGKNDMVKIQVWDAAMNLVLDLPLQKLSNGNFQAHYDQPHGQKP